MSDLSAMRLIDENKASQHFSMHSCFSLASCNNSLVDTLLCAPFFRQITHTKKHNRILLSYNGNGLYYAPLIISNSYFRNEFQIMLSNRLDSEMRQHLVNEVIKSAKL